MKWSKILAAIKAQGYSGADDDVAAMKAYITEAGIDLVDGEGKAIDIDAAFAAHKKKTVKIESDEDDESRPVEIDEKTYKRLVSDAAKAARGTGVEKLNGGKAFSIGNSERKAYDAKAAQGRAMFADADTAEVAGAFMRRATMGLHEYTQKAADLEILKKAGVTYDNSLGGALVPTEFVNQLLYSTEPTGTARKIANVVRCGSEETSYPRMTGIVAMSDVSETGTIGSADPGFGNVILTPKKIGKICYMSNEWLESSAISIADLYGRIFREAYDKAIDARYFLGDGTSTYGGVYGLANALPAGAYFNGSGNAWSALTTADFNKAFGLVENVDQARMAIVCSRQAYHNVCMRLDKAASQFKDLAGGPMGNADGSFLGFPVYFSQDLPTVSASGAKSFYVGDFFGASMVGERRDLTIKGSEEAGFTTDQYAVRATARVAVNIHGDGRGSTYGPVVCIKTS